MKKKIKKTLSLIAYCIVFPFLLFRPFIIGLGYFNRAIYTEWNRRLFKKCPLNVTIEYPLKSLGGKYISIGNNVFLGHTGILTAWDSYQNKKFKPEIIIGDNVSIGCNFHITAINKIQIGSGVLMGKKVTITDNTHGSLDFSELKIRPIKRPIVSKGPVIIGNNVWVGDKVTILPGVNIGEGAVIGANSVVTKNIPSFTVVGGIPAKIIKQITI
jgi:acetyltransferase-like isoleucine patch superfamily enzyme